MPHQVPRITAGPTAVTACIGRASRGPVNDPVPIQSLAAFEATFCRPPDHGGIDHGPLWQLVSGFFANGGTDAQVVRVQDPPTASPDADDDAVSHPRLAPRHEGIWALDRSDQFNLLCIAPPAGGRDLTARTRIEAARYCAAHRAMFVADPLRSWQSAADVISGPDALDSATWGLEPHANVVLYFPALVATGTAGPATVAAHGPSGAVAGVIARTDATRGVWKAPAGRDARLRGIHQLSALVSETESRHLTALAVNPLRELSGVGLVVWGARTLAGADRLASEWKYLPVRRTALWIEDSIERGTQWVADQPNAESTWADVRASVEQFLVGLFREGALQGQTSRNAFFVKCGRDTMTPDDIASGRLIIEVGFAPLKPAEFVILRIHEMTTA